MNWIGAIVGGISGALAVLLFAGGLRLVGGKQSEPKTWHKWAYYGLFALVWGVSKETVTPEVQRWYYVQTIEERLAESNPAFAALQRHEPAAFKQMAAAARESLTGGSDGDAAVSVMRAHFAPLMEKRLPVASDEAATAYMKVTIQEVRELMAGGGDHCYTHLYPGTGPAPDLTRLVKAETLKADLSAAAAVIESAATKPQPALSLEGAILEAAQPAFERLGAKYSRGDFTLVDSPQTALKERRRVCELTVDLFTEVFALQKDSGKVLRALINQ